MERLIQRLEKVREQCRKVVMGSEEVDDMLMVALLCEGHVILEGVPGTGKTLLAKTFARSIGLEFRRIQFTPDIMPADILGTNIFNFQSNEFVLKKGPAFTEFLLADEINRTPPKTQAALLESMQERSITIDGKTYPLSSLFFVVATQNPIEQEGTYPLPEAQLDRFMFKLLVDFPSEEEEREMVRLHGHTSAMPSLDQLGVKPVATKQEILSMRQIVAGLHLSDEIVNYIVSLVRATRTQPNLAHGASSRAANMLATASRALAAVRGRDYVIPDDIKELFFPALRHRVILTPGAFIEGSSSDDILRQVLQLVPVPR